MYKKILLLFVAAVFCLVSSSSELSGNFEQVSEFNFIFKGMFPEEGCCGEEGCEAEDCPELPPTPEPMCHAVVGDAGCGSIDYVEDEESLEAPVFSIAPDMVMSSTLFMASSDAAFYGNIVQEGLDVTAMLGDTTTKHLYVDGDLVVGGFLKIENEDLPFIGPIDSGNPEFQTVNTETLTADSIHSSKVKSDLIEGESAVLDFVESIESKFGRMHAAESVVTEAHVKELNAESVVCSDWGFDLCNLFKKRDAEDKPKYLNTAGNHFRDMGDSFCPVWGGRQQGGKVCEGAEKASARTELHLPNDAAISEIECHFTQTNEKAKVNWFLVETSLTEAPRHLVKLTSASQNYDQSLPLRKNSLSFHKNPIVVNTAVNIYELEVQISGEGVTFHKCSIIYN